MKETLDAVTAINERAYNEYEEAMFFPLVFDTDGMSFKVDFLGSTIFSADDDEREFSESKNEYEPVEGFLIQKINETINALWKDKDKYGAAGLAEVGEQPTTAQGVSTVEGNMQS